MWGELSNRLLPVSGASLPGVMGIVSVLCDLPKLLARSIRSRPGVRGISSSVGSRARWGKSGSGPGGGWRRERPSTAGWGGRGRCNKDGEAVLRRDVFESSTGAANRLGVQATSSGSALPLAFVSWSLSGRAPVGVGGRRFASYSWDSDFTMGILLLTLMSRSLPTRQETICISYNVILVLLMMMITW